MNTMQVSMCEYTMQVSMYELKRALRMLNVKRVKAGSQSPSEPPAASLSSSPSTQTKAQKPVPAVTEEWELEEMYFDGKLYLVDTAQSIS